MDVHLGVEGSNSNGHGEEIDKEGHMMKIIERFRKMPKLTEKISIKFMKAQEK
jgi:hypothetical protein